MTRRLLVVDDDEALLATYRILSDETLEVVTVTTTAAAREVLQSQGFDWVVCDWSLARGQTCEELVRELHADGTRVAILTADARKVRCPAGVNVLEKPLTLNEVVAALQDSREDG